MDLPLNTARPLIMHIDLNSCFAIIEQQANPLYRNKPLVVAAYDSPGGMILASSYEAKALGIKLGYSVRDARQVCPKIIVLTPDPQKYREANKRFKKILFEYTNNVVPKSIDEFVVDLRNSPSVNNGKTMEEIGYEIKDKIKSSIGCYVTVNVGIGTNRFWAKTAANLHKPDGMDVMDASNARDIYKILGLRDLNGINFRYEARLNQNNIFSPTQLFNASADTLKKRVFKSKVGSDWYYRLRGWEIDDVICGRKSFGHSYALPHKTADIKELSKLLCKLSDKTGRRLRSGGYAASGIHLSLGFDNHTSYTKSHNTKYLFFASSDIFNNSLNLLNKAPLMNRVSNLSISVYGLRLSTPEQMDIFSATSLDKKPLAKACDDINDRFGDFAITPAFIMNMRDTIKDRISFGKLS